MKLCYVSGSWAYFTTQELKDQWGDDWNDAPYEHNAGSPYHYSDHDKKEGREPWEIVRVAWDGPFEAPCSEVLNSPFSVEQINKGAVPWLVRSRWNTDLPYVAILAGETLPQFKDKIKMLGGKVYEDSTVR